jgi:hypothetical protein
MTIAIEHDSARAQQTPEWNLWAAMMLLAVQDATRSSDVLKWSTDANGNFELICCHLGISASAIRQRIVQRQGE